MRIVLAAALALVACTTAASPPNGPAPTTPTPAVPTPAVPTQAPPVVEARAANDACTADADCIVTNWAGCCACPQCSTSPPAARSRSAQAAAETQCALMRCAEGRCDLAGMCPPGESAAHFAPTCRAGVCAGPHR